MCYNPFMSRMIDFDIDEVIENAMDVFWCKGYENTSMKDLMDATGLLKGSIYNTFGSKEKLFLKCLQKYGERSHSRFYNGTEPVEYLKNFFKRLVSEGSKKNFVKGCLIMNSCLEFSETNDEKSDKSKKLFNATEENLKNVIKDILPQADKNEIDVLTVHLITAAFSIREISKFRKDSQFLKQIANNALTELDISI